MANSWIICFSAIFIFHSYVDVLRLTSLQQRAVLTPKEEIDQRLYGHGNIISITNVGSYTKFVSAHTFLVLVILSKILHTRCCTRRKPMKRLKKNLEYKHWICSFMKTLFGNICNMEQIILKYILKVVCYSVVFLSTSCFIIMTVTIIIGCYGLIPIVVLAGSENTASGQEKSGGDRVRQSRSAKSTYKRPCTGELNACISSKILI